MLHNPPVESSLSADALAAKDAYLALVNPSHRSHVTNLFLEQARAGLYKPSDVLGRVLAEVRRRLAEAVDLGDAGQVDKWRPILRTLGAGEALDFAAYCITYARLPETARRRMKATRHALYVDAYMQTQAPTASQLGLLRKMGWRGDPPVTTRAEAAELLTALIDRGRRG